MSLSVENDLRKLKNAILTNQSCRIPALHLRVDMADPDSAYDVSSVEVLGSSDRICVFNDNVLIIRMIPKNTLEITTAILEGLALHKSIHAVVNPDRDIIGFDLVWTDSGEVLSLGELFPWQDHREWRIEDYHQYQCWQIKEL